MKHILSFALVAAGLTLGACVTVNTPCPCEGAGGAGGTASASSSTGEAPCLAAHCSDILNGGWQPDEACPGSQDKWAALYACGCTDTCASVCVVGAVCLAFDAAAPLTCKACMGGATGCGPLRNACNSDDGSPTPPATTSASSGGDCSCPAGTPLCPGGAWQCSSPGDYTHSIAGQCGSAQFCAACCDPTDTCSIRGTCQITGIAGAACDVNEACCSGVCTAGACVGGCGVILPGSGAASSSSSSGG
ncbi:MAG: hypothetical protein ABJE95_19565 [Byssovorax sp.]